MPRGWDEIMVGQFAELSMIQASVDNVIDRNLQRLSVLARQPIDTFERMEFGKLMKLMKGIRFLDDIDQIPTDKLTPTFSIDGQVYRVQFKATELSAGQYITLKHVMREIKGDEAERSQRIFECLHEVMAVICIPCRRKLFGLWWGMGSYDGERHRELAQTFRDKMPMSVAYPVAVFFCKVWESWMDNLLDYGAQEVERLTKEMMTSARNLEDFMPSSDGTTSSTSLRMETSPSGSESIR